MSDMKEIKNLAALRGCTVAAMLAASLSIGDGKTAGIKQPQPKLDTKEMPTAPNVSPVVDKPIVTPVIDSVNVEKGYAAFKSGRLQSAINAVSG